MSSPIPAQLVLTDLVPSAPTRARKQFHVLVGRLKTLRQRVAEWRDVHLRAAQRIEHELIPLERMFAERLKQRLHLLDRLYDEARLTQRERDKLLRYLLDTVLVLLEHDDDPALKDIYNRRTDGDFDAENEEESAMFADLMGEVFDLEASDGGGQDDFMDSHAGTHGEAGPATDQPASEQARSRKRPATLAREQREAQETARLKQSMRDIFRKLASELHPDREPDPAERQRKTALMQRANAAYAADDLLGLLELQLEVEQLDQERLDAMDDGRILQFNKILNGQLRELQLEQGHFEHQAIMYVPSLAYAKIKPESLSRALDQELAEMRADIACMERELDELTDVKRLKAWIKACQLSMHTPYS